MSRRRRCQSPLVHQSASIINQSISQKNTTITKNTAANSRPCFVAFVSFSPSLLCLVLALQLVALLTVPLGLSLTHARVFFRSIVFSFLSLYLTHSLSRSPVSLSPSLSLSLSLSLIQSNCQSMMTSRWYNGLPIQQSRIYRESIMPITSWQSWINHQLWISDDQLARYQSSIMHHELIIHYHLNHELIMIIRCQPSIVTRESASRRE